MRKGLYAGSFDPVTIGHADQIRRASSLVDSLTVLVIRNYSKKFMFTEDQRVNMLKDVCRDLPNVNVEAGEGHLAKYILDNGYSVLFRGLRSGADFEYEIQLAQIYASFFKGRAETVYLMTDPRYSFISSSVVKENFMLGADISEWVMPSTCELMKKYFKGEEK